MVPHGLGQQSGNQEAAEGLQAAGTVAMAFGPVGVAVGAGLELAAQIVNLFKPCGNICIAATQIVNQVEPILQQNNQQYFGNPHRTTGDQASALAVVQTAFEQIQPNSGNAALGIAGEKCNAERIGNGMEVDSTSCAYGETYAGEYPPYSSVPYPLGVCWTWTLAYYDPIANDIPPGGDGPATGSASTDTTTLFGFPLTDVLAAAAAVALAVIFI